MDGVVSKNDITGDTIASRTTTAAYRDGWDRIFGKGNDVAKICFEIELDTETGEVMAGVCPPEEEYNPEDVAEDKSYLQPVGSVDEALAAAKDALGAKGEENPMTAMRRGYMGKAKMMMEGGE